MREIFFKMRWRTMNSNKIIPILGLLILLILAIGSLSAADADIDSESIGDTISDIELADEGSSVSQIDDSCQETTQNDNSNIEDSANDEDTISDAEDIEIDDDENAIGEKNTIKSSNLGSSYTFKSSNYNTYFTSNGTIISGKLKAGDVLDCSGNFNKLTFIINIPLTFKSSDKTARFTNCNFKIVEGADGSNFTGLKLTMDKTETPVFDAYNVSDITISNCDIFANASKSHPILFNTVNNSNILNNKVQTTCYVVGWGHPSAIVLSGSHYNNLSNNDVIVNDSNGIYLTGYLGGGDMGQSDGGVNTHNYLFNNTVHSIRGIEWALDEDGKVPIPSSFCYAIQIMGASNEIINNTVYNAYRGISATQSGNKIIGNNISRIHGTWYSGDTNDKGGDYALSAGSNSIVKDNVISDCIINTTGSGYAALSAGKNSNVTNNILSNIDGTGMELSANNILVKDNEIDATNYGIHSKGNISGVVISNNVIYSGDKAAIKLEKKSRTLYPHDFIIQNNDLHSTATTVIDVDSACTNIVLFNNTGDSGSEPSGDEETIHYIMETNFYEFFSLSGNLESRVKENDTLIFIGSFKSKGKLYINNKVTLTGINANFTDTTFIIEDNDVLVDNITIDNPNTGNADRLWGIQINNVSGVTIQNCNISIFDPYSAFAIYILDSSNCNVINNNLEAKGNYFTSAILSFNSRDLNIVGNTLKTVGCGEVYLLNNRSCLDGYLNYYSNDGSFVCPDGYTLCPDGSIVCPDGTTISAEEYRICVDGSIVCTDGSIICPDGSIICFDGSQICPDGSVCVDGTTYCLDGTILYENGNKLVAGGYLICIDGSIVCPDGSVYASDEYDIEDGTNNYLCPDGTVICPDGNVICPDGSTICPDGTTICPDGTTICADGTTICPDGSMICADGTQICPDGSIICPDGTVYGPGEYTIDDDGNYLCPDGTTIICPDGSGSSSSTILDGVVPGSHMVSGLYRTYGFLMVHTSNALFANNTVNVSSTLPDDYDLNESYNSIAGVFIHYGGFNNTITNNSIVFESNDPVIYGIGIIGAPLNSTAAGSVNNSFTYNNITIRGSYLTVGLLLGNKVFESDIEYNKFNITSGKPSPKIVNYNTSANNVIENNEFIVTLGTEFSFENIVITVQKVREGSIFYVVVLKDREGNILANKPISLTFNNTEINCTTNDEGMATLEIDVKEVGTYNILMKFDGDEDYFASSATGKITVRKTNTSLSVSNVSYKTTDATKTITATLKDENGVALSGKTIKFVVNGVTYNGTTNANGVATVKVNLNAGGTYTISASFAEDDGYASSSASGKLTLNKQSTSLTSSGKTYTVTNTAKKITVTLKDGNKKTLANKKITATVNGKTYSAKTNAKGVATIKLTLNKVKTFSVALKFAGDSTYAASSKTIKVKVTKTKTKLAVPKKTYKKAAKTKKLTATLKDSTGKVLKSKKVKFTVNGKTYTAKTNKKGVVTVKVKLSKKKTYKVTVKFAGDSQYLAVTKTGKVVIK